MADKKTATKKQAKEKKLVPMSSLDQKKYELRKRGYELGLQSGGRATPKSGRATHGYGKAYMKGGKVK